MRTDSSNKPVVAEFVGLYLPRTETFIYGYLRGLSRVQPAVFANELANLDLFPYDDVTLVPLPPKVVRTADGLARAATGRRPLQEKRLRDAMLRRSPRLIHGHFGWSAWATMPMKRDLGIPLVTTFYGADMSSRPNQPDFARDYDQLFRCGDLFLVEGPYMRERLIELGAPAEKVRVQHIGVDVSAIRFEERRPSADGTVRLLMCSSFVEKKGVPYGIEAFAQCGHPEARLTIAGDGPLRPVVEETIERCGVADRVQLVGLVDHAQFHTLLRETHVFLAPSVTAADGDSEGGAPTVLLEAQASGAPVVSTFHADIPSVVPDGASGYLVPERDVVALSSALGRLLDDPGAWPRMGRTGREHVAHGYDLPDQARRLEEAYFSVMN